MKSAKSNPSADVARVSYTGTGVRQRAVVHALLTNAEVCKRITLVWPKEGMFRTKVVNLVCEWAVAHFQKYGEPIGKNLLVKLDAYSQKVKGEGLVKDVNGFLAGLNLEFATDTPVNVGFVLTQAEEMYKEVQAERMVEAVRKALDSPLADMPGVDKAVAEFVKPVRLTGSSGLTMSDLINDALSEEANEVLVRYPGDAGKFFGDDLCRCGFVAFQAPEKRGKSNWLIDVAFRALRERRKVLFFTVGDLTAKQVASRFLVRAAGRPIKPQKDVYRPKEIVQKENMNTDIVWETSGITKSWDSRLTQEMGKKVWDDFRANKVKSDEDTLRIIEHPASSCKASEVKREAIIQASQGWVPDVIVIDYVDLLAPEGGQEETRNQINASWKVLNGIRMELNCLVLTATQADAEAHEVYRQSPKNFSEDKRKSGHVTGLIGINQVEDEVPFGVQRLNWLFRREAEGNRNRDLVCAGCRPINNPCVLSVYPKLEATKSRVADKETDDDDE